jgi:hypothetical protein
MANLFLFSVSSNNMRHVTNVLRALVDATKLTKINTGFPRPIRSLEAHHCLEVTEFSQPKKFPDWPPGARTANGTAVCH